MRSFEVPSCAPLEKNARAAGIDDNMAPLEIGLQLVPGQQVTGSISSLKYGGRGIDNLIEETEFENEETKWMMESANRMLGTASASQMPS